MIHVVLVEPEIPWNTGNAGRSCLALGAQLHLVEPLGFSLEAAQVRRAGLDYWARVAPVVWSSWDACEAALGPPWLFTAEGAQDLWDVAFEDPAVLVFGKESVGLDPALRARWPERTVRIPMVDREIRSLNVSTTVGIALAEVARQRRAALARGRGSY